jgi:putative FmdB family regulatory protein
MPLYGYSCRACGHEFEKLTSISNKDLPKSEPCPSCGEVQVQEHISTMNFRLNDVKPSGEFNELLQKIQNGSGAKHLKN